ncbi:MAG: zinc ribbon domain-containing protein [Chloroflexota bacterium]|nr:zinc ribbon domain-containing protein [Chloroflexota bacterium]
MPLYDYNCANGHAFETRHGFNDPAPACPVCGEADVRRVITSAPSVMHGVSAPVSKYAGKDELRAKWSEETPKLREQLVKKLGEDTVNTYAPSLNTHYD